jgi:hypothetical protein
MKIQRISFPKQILISLLPTSVFPGFDVKPVQGQWTVFDPSQYALQLSKGIEASNLSTKARRVSTVAGVEGGLVANLGKIRANQFTQTMIAEANRNFWISSSNVSTRRENGAMQAENTGMKKNRTLDGSKQNALRTQGTNQRFGMLNYEAVSGGGNIPIRNGFEFHDYMNDKQILQKSTNITNQTTNGTYQLQNENTQSVTQQKIDASNIYQSEMNSAFNR